MDLDLYLAFLLATTVLILIPGPNVTLLVANSLAHGRRRALITLAGTSSAIALQLLVVALGMTSLILVLAQWFEWLRWAGVAYLIYLGIQQWRAPPLALDDAEGPVVRSGTLFWQGVLVSATNPKTLLFYAAFFPQFVDPSSPPGPQLGLLCATFLLVATVLDGAYAILAGRLRPWLRTRQRARLRNRLTGTFLIAAALGLALARRGS
jgi:threonine/homoserine/homoserine lactone efflux protein